MNLVKELAQATVVVLVMFGPLFYYMLFSMKP
jgi:hypothetical protein